MCGRYSLKKDASAYSEYLLDLGFEEFHDVPRYNIAPTQFAPIVRLGPHNQPELAKLRWGLVPSWSKDRSIGARMINARAETVTQKPSFRAAFKRRRALIPADGYFEWMKVGPEKRPYRFHLRRESVFTMAGLWEAALLPDGSEMETFSIITCPPNAIASKVHDRMPVIIPPEEYGRWLETDETEAKSLVDLLVPYADEDLEFDEVSKKVNNPKNDVPECIEPLNGSSPSGEPPTELDLWT